VRPMPCRASYNGNCCFAERKVTLSPVLPTYRRNASNSRAARRIATTIGAMRRRSCRKGREIFRADLAVIIRSELCFAR
jgi:hypothetical protein